MRAPRRRQMERREWRIDAVSDELRPPKIVVATLSATSFAEGGEPTGRPTSYPLSMPVRVRKSQSAIRWTAASSRGSAPSPASAGSAPGPRASLNARSIQVTKTVESIITVSACIASMSAKKSLPWVSFAGSALWLARRGTRRSPS